MYEVLTNVIYGTNGVCKIVDIRKEKFRGVERSYYVMKPMSDKESTIFVPTDNENSVSKIKPLLTADEIMKLIHDMPGEEAHWEENDKLRKEQYTDIIEKGDRKALIGLIKTVHEQQIIRESTGKKLWATDENALKQAEKILYEEFAIALDTAPENVPGIIMQELEFVPPVEQ